MQPLVNEKQLSELIGMSVNTLRRWRWIGQGGPRFIKIGTSVRYDVADVKVWVERQRQVV
jgi:predicted DNA-binding transcriptional regulator AlpA